MENKYFINEKNIKEGPLSLKELEDKKITTSTLIWYDGLEDWRLVSEIDNLKHLIIKEIPKPPPTPNEIKLSKKKKLLLQIIKESLIFCSVITCITFLILGGLFSDKSLEELYTLDNEDKIWSFPNDLRLIVLPTVAFFFISLPATILIAYYKFRSKVEKDEKAFQLIFTKAFSYAITIPMIFFIYQYVFVNNKNDYENMFRMSVRSFISLFVFMIYLITIATIIISKILNSNKVVEVNISQNEPKIS